MYYIAANSNTYSFGFVLFFILHRLAALCSSIVTRDWLVFCNVFELWKFRYLYDGIMSCQVVMQKIESNLDTESFSSGESPITNVKCCAYVFCCMYVLCQNPTVSNWFPRKGPRSGGTLVVVTGSDLHYGSTVKVMMNNRLPASIIR